MGNQVSNSFGHGLYFESAMKFSGKKQGVVEKQTAIGILSFEVANVMSKIIHLHKSLTETEILKLKNDIFKSSGIRALVCCDERKLLDLALAEKLEDVNRVASAVSRLGKKCTIPALQGFEHIYEDIVGGIVDVKDLSFLVKDMESCVRKMERFVSSTASLYDEIEVMNKLEVTTKKFQQSRHQESREAFEQKLLWQKQDVNRLKDISLWNQTFDKVVELLGRSVCTTYARLRVVLTEARYSTSISLPEVSSNGCLPYMDGDSWQQSSNLSTAMKCQTKATSVFTKTRGSCPEKKAATFTGYRSGDLANACGMGAGRLLMQCLTLSSPVSKLDCDQDDDQRSQISSLSIADSVEPTLSQSITFDHQRRSKTSSANGVNWERAALDASPSTIGGSALSLHYANVIIVIEKLLRYPHLIGEEARHELYQMLPASLRKKLKKNLKSYTKDLAIYDAPVAHDWSERLEHVLKWLSPLAHNTIRWQSERNFEQQQIVSRTNVLLLQTLYFADREKTETAICELLVGLNYICRYEQQQNALLDCASSFDFEDCTEWQPQFAATATFH